MDQTATCTVLLCLENYTHVLRVPIAGIPDFITAKKKQKKKTNWVLWTKGKTAIEIKEGGFDKRGVIAKSTGASQ